MDGSKAPFRPTGPIIVDTALPAKDVVCSLLKEGAPPLFIEPLAGRLTDKADFLAWAARQRPVLDKLILDHGGIVLRGFALASAEDFDDAAGVFPPYERGYLGGNSPRAKVAGKVLESTRLREDFRLPVHSEMAYLDRWPPRIAFFCKTAPTVGGETIIGDLRAITRHLPEAYRERITRLGTRHVRNYAAPGASMDIVFEHPDQVPWDVALRATDKADVERTCQEIGLQPIWNADDSVTLVNYLPAFTTHPATGASIYRTSIHNDGRVPFPLPEEVAARQAMPTGQSFGDGSHPTDEEKAQVYAVYDAWTYAWPWQAGDMMILDNLQVGHGRNPYQGPREILVALLN